MRRALMMAALFGLLFCSSSYGAIDRVVVMELFTNCGCPACGDNDPWIKTFVESHPESLVVVAYHVWWPWTGDPFYQANIAENTARTNFYGVNSAPHVIMDGWIPPGYPYTVGNLETSYTYANSQVTSAGINLSGSYEPAAKGGTGTLKAEVVAFEAQSGSDLRVVIALTESNILYTAPNGIREHNWVMRDMLPNQNGTPVSFSAPYPDTVVVEQDFVVNSAWNPGSCTFVVILQNFGTAQRIKQGAEIALSDLSLTGVAAERGGPGATRVALGRNFPNPCNPATVIPVFIGQETAVSLRIYDVEGREVRSLLEHTLRQGTHEIEWDGKDDRGQRVASGLYFCRLEAAGERLARKLVVVQ